MKKHKIAWLCITLSLFIMKNALASTIEKAGDKGKIIGMVIDSASGVKVEYATVALYKKADASMTGGMITDATGGFEIKQIPDGKYYMLIQFVGFSPKRIDNIEIDSKHAVIQMGRIILNPSSKQLNEVNITGQKRLVEYKLDKKIINAIGQLAATGGTAIDILRNSPSVCIDNEDNVSIRGKSDFQVFINGRPSVLKGADALKQIPAANIENIEIITNPSANQDAEGTAGMINIITKKNTMQGTGAMASVTGGSDRYSADLSVSHQLNKWNFTLGAKYMYYNVPVENTDERTHYFKDSTLFINDHSIQYHSTKMTGINWGVDYDLDKNNMFSLALNYGTWRHFHDFKSEYNYSNSLIPTPQYSFSKNDYQIGNQYFSGNLFYKHIFGKTHDLSINFFYSLIDGDRSLEAFQYLSDYEFGQLVINKMSRSNETNLSKDIRLKIDYTRPVFGNMQMESGIQAQIKPYDAEMKFDNFNITDNLWRPDILYTNDILFDVNLYAAYVTLSGTAKKIEYKLGLRSEYYERNFAYKNSDISYPYDQFDLFPTLHLSYKLSEKNQYQLSISRRVTRPSAWYMYPIPDYSDNYFVASGNPDLRPEFLKALEFDYIHNFNKALLSFELFHRWSDGTFTQRLIADEKGVLHQQTINSGNEYFTGFEAALNADIYKWMSVNVSSSMYYALIKINTADTRRSIETNVLNVRMNTTFTPYKNTKLQLALQYDAPFDYIQSHYSERFNANVSVREDFPKQKASVTLTARNPIGGSKSFNDVKENNFIAHTMTEMKATYSITLSFSLNNYKRQKNVGQQLNASEGSF